jgi:hypothetical protein
MPRCQICGRTNHLAPQCWYRYNDGYQKGNKPSVVMASMSSYSVEAPWYSDTDATDHITNDLERLDIHEKYHGKEKIQTAGGSGMPIRHVGHSMIHTPARALHLRHILHAPQATKHLLSVPCFTRGPYHFLVKDSAMKIPLHGRCISGLYLLSKAWPPRNICS